MKEFKCVGGSLDGSVVKLRDGYDYLTVYEGIGQRYEDGTYADAGIIDHYAIYVSHDGQTLEIVHDKFNDKTAAEFIAEERARAAAWA